MHLTVHHHSRGVEASLRTQTSRRRFWEHDINAVNEIMGEADGSQCDSPTAQSAGDSIDDMSVPKYPRSHEGVDVFSLADLGGMKTTERIDLTHSCVIHSLRRKVSEPWNLVQGRGHTKRSMGVWTSDHDGRGVKQC